MLIPPNSYRARVIRRFLNITWSAFVKIRRNLGWKKDLALIQTSSYFDEAWYLTNNPDVARANVDPARHYLLFGGFEGRDPGPEFSSALYLKVHDHVRKSGMNPLVHFLRGRKQRAQISNDDGFDAQVYLAMYPELNKAGIDPYQHYHRFGKSEGRLGNFPEFIFQGGFAKFEPSRDTVLVASHEASRTGAPILSLNLVQNLQKKYNVVTVLSSGGPIVEHFINASVLVVGPFPPELRYDPTFAQYLIDELTKIYQFKFAIFNSIGSQAVLPAVARQFIPAILLIHEFAAFIRPRGYFQEAALWSHEIIFSAPITRENALFEYPELSDHSVHVIPQGLCSIPSLTSEADNREENTRLLNTLRPNGLPSETVVVLGVGTVGLRKGVDLFIECAAGIAQSEHGRDVRFIWIGQGYDPDNDVQYSIYLAEQIRRCGLEESVFIIKDTPNIETAYKAADILLISSRLDPLPNVGIDAMMHKLPVLCFDKATGIADILIANGLKKECVAPYLDTAEMTDRILALIASKPMRQRVGEQLHQLALKEFNMEKYVGQVEEVGLAAADSVCQEKTDIAEIESAGLARMDFYLPPYIKPQEAIPYYVRTWASGVRRRKLFPGFHPGIFQERSASPQSKGDPLAGYVRAGQPDGPWRYEVITSEETAKPLPPETRIALHLHIYYPDLLPELLDRLNGNQVRPDLFISVPTGLVREEVEARLLGSYSGKVAEIQVVPNRGRDIGPFLNTFGSTFVDRYDVVGHLHTKKTNVQEESTKNWFLFLLENLLGGRSTMADIILGSMAADPSIGMVFPDDPNSVGWRKNKPYAEVLGQRLGLDNLPKNLVFPVGTMFWARVESLLPVFQLGLGWQDYPTEPLPYDGTMLHALERLLPFVAAKQGFRSVLTNVPGLTR